jgi:phage-related protein (TIGR01555 family)
MTVKKKRATESVATDAVANDAFTNAAARMGFGTPSVAEGTDYVLERWTNDYWLMITLFRNHWIARRIVEKPAQDMCKAWPRINTSQVDANGMKEFDRVINRTYTPARIEKALKWARLFGGAGCLMVIDGHEDILDEPLELDEIAPGSYKGLITFDRWSGIYPEGNIASDINSPVDFGYPEFYKVNGQNGDSFLVHHSRILRFQGPDVPAPENSAAMYWGISELEIAFEEIRKRDNMSWSILQLLFRAQILTQKNPELAQLLSGAGASAKAQQQFANVMQAQNELLSNQSMLILGKDAELQSHQYTFGGVSEIYQQFQMDISGAARIPVSILFGRTATGLSQSNDADIRIYEQEIGQKQHEELEPQLHKLYPVVCMSLFGEVPDDLDVDFPSVRVLNEEEKAKLAKDGGDLIVSYYQAGIMTQKTAMQEAKQLADVTGIGTNITDEQIEQADDNVQLALEMQQEQLQNNEQKGNEEE